MDEIAVPRELLIRVDSICSLVGYRYATNLPADIRDDLRDISWQARKLYEARAGGDNVVDQ